MAQGVRDGGFAYGPMEGLFTVVSAVDEILPTMHDELANMVPVSSPGHPDLTET